MLFFLYLQSDNTTSSDQTPAPPPEEGGTTPTIDEPTITGDETAVPTDGIVPEALHVEEEAEGESANQSSLGV